MSNFRKFCAATALLLAFSHAAQASSGWMSTGVQATPTPQMMKLTATTEECETAIAAIEESSYTLDLALEVSFTILRSALALL
jgi:hypothetical protein